MKSGNRTVGTRLRIVLAPDIAMGPGKADILQAIKETGSIAAACRRMDMSYKRAWMLVETMNHGFRIPLVETAKGGKTHGGAMLTPAGAEVLALYRRMEALTDKAIAREIKAMRRLLAVTSR